MKSAWTCIALAVILPCFFSAQATSQPRQPDIHRNVPFRQTTDLVKKLRSQKVAFEELIVSDEIHDLLHWSDWIRAYRATSEFFDRRLAASGERQ